MSARVRNAFARSTEEVVVAASIGSREGLL
jgi:hypothetical protein